MKVGYRGKLNNQTSRCSVIEVYLIAKQKTICIRGIYYNRTKTVQLSKIGFRHFDIKMLGYRGTTVNTFSGNKMEYIVLV